MGQWMDTETKKVIIRSPIKTKTSFENLINIRIFC